jgi:hypothetical protein
MTRPTRWMLLALTLLAAGSGISQRVRDQQLLRQYLQYAGAPIDHFTYVGRFDSWRSLSRAQLLAWTNLNDAYLLRVREPCIDLQFTNRIGLSRTAGTVTNRLDSVLLDRDKCQISEIRRVDYGKCGLTCAKTGSEEPLT